MEDTLLQNSILKYCRSYNWAMLCLRGWRASGLWQNGRTREKRGVAHERPHSLLHPVHRFLPKMEHASHLHPILWFFFLSIIMDVYMYLLNEESRHVGIKRQANRDTWIEPCIRDFQWTTGHRFSFIILYITNSYIKGWKVKDFFTKTRIT